MAAGPRASIGESRVERLIAAVLRRVLGAAMKRTFRAGLPIEAQRRRLHAIARCTLVPRSVRFSPATIGGIAGEEVVALSGGGRSCSILYLHGGGYCVGSPDTHRAITGRLARACDARVFAADYRLAPEHPFPAAVDDAVAAWRGLAAQRRGGRDTIVAGDSAGGGLAVALALRLRGLGEPLPRALVLFSPWVDLEREQPAEPPPGEIMLNAAWIRECVSRYVGDQDAGDPLVSPLKGDLGGLPPTLIQVGSDELLRGDSAALHLRLQSAGVASTLQEFPARWHVFQANAGVLADADRALGAVAQFVHATAL